MRGAFVVEDRASGACSQWAEIIRMLSGLGRSADHVASSLVQVRSSASGGAPWLRYRTGIRLVAAAESAVVVMGSIVPPTSSTFNYISPDTSGPQLPHAVSYTHLTLPTK